MRVRKKQKKLFNCAIRRKMCLFLMQNSLLAILLAMLRSRKPVQRRGIGEKCGFFLLAGRHQRVEEGYQFVSNWPFSSQKRQIYLFQDKQVCNVKKKNLQCLSNVNSNFLILMIKILVE